VNVARGPGHALCALIAIQARESQNLCSICVQSVANEWSLMSIATKTGDDGTTGLMFNRRVAKTDPRVATYGACDELNAALGMVRAWNEETSIVQRVLDVQKELVILMGELACAEEDRARYREKGFHFVEQGMVDRLTDWLDDLERNHKISYKHWATPGTTKGSAVLDQARVACRRAERAVWVLKEGGFAVAEVIPRYLNRLSDLCWLWARYVETKAGLADGDESGRD
jgi:cob(I)alamin adenosyltransferase